MTKFSYTILYVSNVEKSIEFYEKSFDFVRKFITPENDYGELNTGETTIAFATKELAGTNLKKGFIENNIENKPFATELGIVTDDVSKILEKVEIAGGMLIEEPKQKPWGQTVAYVRDIDGFLIEVCTPVNM